MNEPPHPNGGDILDDRYRLEKVIGRGGMGQVYVAEQLNLGRRVAIKVLPTDMEDRTEEYEVRFRREALAASRLQHPNIVQIVDYGRDPRYGLYLAMEFLDGVGFGDIIYRQQPLGFQRIADLLIQTLSALEAAHASQILHRDIKPANIMACNIPGRPDFVKVLDFGIARALGAGFDNMKLTRAGTVCGTPTYMAPEQAMGKPLDGRADLYSVGTIFFEMLTGRLPFDEPNPMDYLVRKVNENPPPATVAASGSPIPPELSAICARSIARSREGRYPDVASFRMALENWLRPRPTAGASMPPHPNPWGSASTAPTPKAGNQQVTPSNVDQPTVGGAMHLPDTGETTAGGLAAQAPTVGEKMAGGTWDELIQQDVAAPELDANAPTPVAVPEPEQDQPVGPYPRIGRRVIGRDELLTELGQSMERAESQGWASWLLLGARGAGRSRLLAAAANMAGAAGWELFLVRPTAPDVSPFLTPGDLMAQAKADGPRVVVIDDLDLLPVELQDSFFDPKWFRDRPTLVVGSALTLTGANAGSHRRQLTALTPGERQMMASDFMGDEPLLQGPDLCYPAWLQHRTFLDAENNRLQAGIDGVWSYASRAPRTMVDLDTLIRDRVRALTSQQQRLLHMLALAPLGLDEDGLSQMKPGDQSMPEILESLEQAGFIECSGRRWLIGSRSIARAVGKEIRPGEEVRLHAEMASISAHAARYARGARRRYLLLQQSIHCEKAGQSSKTAVLLQEVAEVLLAVEQPKRAIAPLQKALSLSRAEVEWTTTRIRQATLLAHALTEAGEPAGALEVLAPVSIRQRLGPEYGAAVQLTRAEAMVGLVDPDAQQALEQAGRMLGETNDSELQVNGRLVMAAAALKRRDRAAAQRHVEQALTTFQFGDIPDAARLDAELRIGRIQTKTGNKDDAHERFLKIVDDADRLGLDHVAGRARLALASVLIERGDTRGAARHLDDIRNDLDMEPVLKARAALNRALLFTIMRDGDAAKAGNMEALAYAARAGWYAGMKKAARAAGIKL